MNSTLLSLEQEPAQISAAQQNPEAFRPLYEKYHKSVFLFVYRRVDDRQMAADITSQVFLKALQHLGRYQITQAPFSAWLNRIAHNEVMQFFRKNKQVRKVVIDEHLLSELQHEQQSKDYQEWRMEKLLKALESLELTDMQLIEMRFFEHKAFKEIAFILDITENNAKVKTYRLLDKLRKKMEQ